MFAYSHPLPTLPNFMFIFSIWPFLNFKLLILFLAVLVKGAAGVKGEMGPLVCSHAERGVSLRHAAQHITNSADTAQTQSHQSLIELLARKWHNALGRLAALGGR